MRPVRGLNRPLSMSARAFSATTVILPEAMSCARIAEVLRPRPSAQ